METVCEELVRHFNEESNEEAGEHWTPSDTVKLMATLNFPAVADEIESGAYLLDDGALGAGGLLAVAAETLQERATRDGKQIAVAPERAQDALPVIPRIHKKYSSPSS